MSRGATKELVVGAGTKVTIAGGGINELVVDDAPKETIAAAAASIPELAMFPSLTTTTADVVGSKAALCVWMSKKESDTSSSLSTTRVVTFSVVDSIDG